MGKISLNGIANDGTGGSAVLLDVGVKSRVGVLGQADLAARGASAAGGVGRSAAWAVSLMREPSRRVPRPTVGTRPAVTSSSSWL